MRRLAAYPLVLAGCVALLACDDGPAEPAGEPEPTSALGRKGEAIYRSTVEDGNSFACATCHALVEPASDFRRPGHPIGDAAARQTFKNGQLTDLREAVNSCLTEWMNAEAWSEDDQRWVALSTFLDEIAPSSAKDLTFEVLPAPTASQLEGGDPDAGRELFNGSCAVCHGRDGAGTERGIPLAGRAFDPAYVGTRVRTSGLALSPIYEGLTGGLMPFWAADRLSNDELSNIAAWLAQGEGNADGGDDGASDDAGDDGANDGSDDNGDDTGDGGGDTGGPDDSGSDDTGGGSGNCPATHPKVGQTAELVEAFHDVGGTAEIIDDCTIRITDFTYDATGIDVRLYGGLGGDFDNGFPLGDDLVRPEPYSGETIDFALPQGVTLDDLDGVSVWCVDVGVDFGSGFFE